MKTNGFSLIEMLVYIAVLVFMLVIIVAAVFSIARSDRLIRSVRDIENSAVLVMERITREIREADSVSLASSVLDSHPGKLVLQGESGNTEFYFSSGRIFVKENGVELGALTAASVKVTSIKFTRFASSTVEGIRTELTLESGTSTYYRTQTLYSSAVIR
jgi:Tfp pilus assembly protein FimT